MNAPDPLQHFLANCAGIASNQPTKPADTLYALFKRELERRFALEPEQYTHAVRELARYCGV